MSEFWLTGIFLPAAAAGSSILFHTSATKRVLISFSSTERKEKKRRNLITLHFIHWRDLYPLHKRLIGHFIMFCHPQQDPASPLRLIPSAERSSGTKAVITASACWKSTQRKHEVWNRIKDTFRGPDMSGAPHLKGNCQELLLNFFFSVAEGTS